LDGTEKVINDALAGALKALTPKTKAGMVRDLMPLIEEKIDQGVRISDILEVLKAGGLELSEGTFKNYLHRVRSRHGKPRMDRSVPSKDDQERRSEVEGPAARAPDAGQQGPPTVAVSMPDLDRLIKPDPTEQADELARYERLAKQQRRSQRS
jgi:hypothetical protein